MASILKDRSFKLSIILTFIFFGTGTAFLFLGLTGYGWALFILLPIVLGISIGAMPNKKYSIIGAILATVIYLLGLYVPGLSGLICIIMTLPIVVPMIFLGYIVSHLVQRYRELKETDTLPILLMPLIPFLIAAPIEHAFNKNKEAIVEVKTEQVFNYTPEQVYDAIKSVDTLDADKPFLMTFDLPIPTKCVLEKKLWVDCEHVISVVAN